jgi:hypothetical protein
LISLKKWEELQILLWYINHRFLPLPNDHFQEKYPNKRIIFMTFIEAIVVTINFGDHCIHMYLFFDTFLNTITEFADGSSTYLESSQSTQVDLREI